MRQKDSTKYQRIIDAATKIFAKKGFYKAKVAEIAKDNGIGCHIARVYINIRYRFLQVKDGRTQKYLLIRKMALK